MKRLELTALGPGFSINLWGESRKMKKKIEGFEMEREPAGLENGFLGSGVV